MVGSKENTEIIVVTIGIGLHTDQSVVALFNQPLEDTVKDCPGNATNGICALLAKGRESLKTLFVVGDLTRSGPW